MERISERGRDTILFESIRMTRLCAWIYDTDADGFPAQAPPLEEPVQEVIRIGSTRISTQGAAIVTSRTIYLVFRGSQGILTSAGWRDWLLNAKFLIRAEYYGLRAHRGFVKAAKPVLKQVRRIVERYPDRQIEIGGHSLGGSVGTAVTVAVVNWIRQSFEYRPVKLITLGQPKFSRKRQLNLSLSYVPYTRIQNGSDIVARLPKLWYSHAGMNLYLSNRGDLLWNPGTMRKFADRLFTFRQRVKDHSTSGYLAELLRHAAQRSQ